MKIIDKEIHRVLVAQINQYLTVKVTLLMAQSSKDWIISDMKFQGIYPSVFEEKFRIYDEVMEEVYDYIEKIQCNIL